MICQPALLSMVPFSSTTNAVVTRGQGPFDDEIDELLASMSGSAVPQSEGHAGVGIVQSSSEATREQITSPVLIKTARSAAEEASQVSVRVSHEWYVFVVI